MRFKNYYLPTLREVPADAEIPSHILMLRAGMMRKSAMGIYSYLPMGLKVIKKIEEIVRKHMDSHGAMEILMSALQPQEIWDQSGRWKTFGPEMFKLRDRHDRSFCLGPTAEEYFTSLIKGEVKSYKQLPLNIYQIQTKYRDEKRPRFGINRAREFSMKDAYTFDKTFEDLEVAYKNMWDAYEKIFDELGLDYKIVSGDTGAMGGKKSHEFIALSDVGEGVIVYTDSGDFAATDEKAEVAIEDYPREDKLEKEKIKTPGLKTIEEISDFLKVPRYKCLKAIDLMAGGERVFVFIPGDRELNMSKLVSYLKVPDHEIYLMDDQNIKEAKSEPGFTGPIGLKGRIIVDERVPKIDNMIVGSNEEDFHILNVNYKRDFEGEVAGDILMVQEGDLDPRTKEELKFARGIEVGNIFQLGTKYSEALDAKFLDENGKEEYFVMGSYGIGITRTVTAIIEQNHDDDGIIWPLVVAPFKVIITVVNIKDDDQVEMAEKIYKDFTARGIEVLLDDRKERAGVKFKDRDLIGIPYRITVGKNAKDGIVEFSTRRERDNSDMSIDEAIKRVEAACDKSTNITFSKHLAGFQ